jgi:hypothetical protein
MKITQSNSLHPAAQTMHILRSIRITHSPGAQLASVIPSPALHPAPTHQGAGVGTARRDGQNGSSSAAGLQQKRPIDVQTAIEQRIRYDRRASDHY